MNLRQKASSAPTFEQFTYKRPDLREAAEKFDHYLGLFGSANSAEEQGRQLKRLNAVREHFRTMYNLCYVRHTANTADPYYEQENAFFDENLPAFESMNQRLWQAMLHSPFREELEKKFGKQLFVLAELSQRAFDDRIIDDLQQENTLCTEYDKVKAQAILTFEGAEYNLSSIHPLEISDDRALRKRASLTKWQFFADKAGAIEDIFSQMVGLRHGISQKLGFNNFVEVGYSRMFRSDYTPAMVADFRAQVRDIVVPLASELYARQQRRIGVDKLAFYDEDYKFASGNPKPQGDAGHIVAQASRMYGELSPETGRFFDYLQNSHLMDLVNRDGKVTGGYCTYMSQFKAPFIFSNFNGTSGDIDVLTHEAGHAFQVWLSGRFPFGEYHWPTSDAAEIHSMGMEFFTWPWMPLFFGPDTDKYYYMHLASAVEFLPYGVAVDAFQHLVYENPDMSAGERNAAWRQLEKTYLPHRNYDGFQHLEEGRFWQKQSHIFTSPFYYIDYTLAQICALQFWKRDRAGHEKAWKDYVRLCRAGGSRSFLDLVKLARIQSPFQKGVVQEVMREVRDYLDKIDDQKF